MKKMLCIVGLLCVLFASCDTGTGGGSGDLAISTIWWEEGSDGFTRFFSNEPQYYEYGFWHVLANGGRDTYEIECKKMSGSAGVGYGMLFAVSNTDDDFYRLLISGYGRFNISKRDGDTWSLILDWTGTDALYTGYNKLNTLKVTRSGTSYTVFINDTQVHRFTDSSGFGDRIGFCVGIGTEADENFPNNPVDARFRLK